MRSQAQVEFGDAERLARQLARHFGHKVEVETVGARQVVHIPAGTFQLDPEPGGLAVIAEAPDGDSLARVEQVCADHLRRFAHVPLAIEWAPAD